MTQSRRLMGALAIAGSAVLLIALLSAPDALSTHAVEAADLDAGQTGSLGSTNEASIAQIEQQLAQLQSMPKATKRGDTAKVELLVADVEAGLDALRKNVSGKKQEREIARLADDLQAVKKPKLELFKEAMSVQAAQNDMEYSDPAEDDEEERENQETFDPNAPPRRTQRLPLDDMPTQEAADAPSRADADEDRIGDDTGGEEPGATRRSAEDREEGGETAGAVGDEDAADKEAIETATGEAGADAEGGEGGEAGEEAGGETGDAVEGAVDEAGDVATPDTETGEPGPDEMLPEPPGPREGGSVGGGDANTALSRGRLALEAGAGATTAGATAGDVPSPAVTTNADYKGDPLERRVNLDFREMETANVVALLAHMANINVVAGTDITGTVTANLQDVPLRAAIETVLRLEGLGMIEEEGIYRIVPYEEAQEAIKETAMIKLEHAKAEDVAAVLDDLLQGGKETRIIQVSANEFANVVVITGPSERIQNLVTVAHQLDVEEPVLTVVTEPIKLNYAEPEDLVETVEAMLTPDIGEVAVDQRARHIVVTDAPVIIEQVRQLLASLDMPVKQVAIDAMVVDVNLEDEASTGVDWLLDAVRRQSRRDAALGTGDAVGILEELGTETNLGLGDAAAGLLSFNLLSSNVNWQGVVQAEVRNFNGKLVSNPVLVTVENKPAKIEIVREIPYVELTQTQQGGSQTSTEFKIVGTVLQVTPRVTHEDDIIVDLQAKESDTSGEFNGIPIEDKRELETTVHMRNGQTIFTGGLRKNSDDTTVRKVPILGDVPVMNLLFRQNTKTDEVNELLIFMTCRVVAHDKELTGYQQGKVEEASQFELKVDSFNEIAHDTVYPGEARDPVWKWRRAD